MVTDFKGGAVCFTFDDSRYTDWLAQRELFKKYNAHATFFYSGELTESHIQSMRLLQADGHTVGLHSVYHLNCDMTDEENLEEYIRKMNDKVMVFIRMSNLLLTSDYYAE